MRALCPFAFGLILVCGVSAPALARHVRRRPEPDRTSSPPNGATDASPAAVTNALHASAVANTTVLYEVSFDTGGSCDESGWTTVDITAQVGTFFHVDDYAGLDPAHFAPLAGTKSLWCGARPASSGPLCGYLALPGYGNGWNQAFCTKNCITVSADSILDVSFLARFDSEPSYDYTALEYTTDCTGSTGWTTIDGGKTVWTGRLPASNWIQGASYGGAYNIGTTGPVKVRLHFVSDRAWSDEDGLWDTDGGVHIDNLQVEDGAVEDFEDEAVGATESNGWQNCPVPGFGNYAGLLHGTGVLQEDPCARDLSCMWVFFLGSKYNYACGGHPEQTAVPFGNARGQYLDNEIWSPGIPVTGSGDNLMLEFSVYRDEPLDNMVFYVWRVRDVSGTCPGPWRDRNFVYYGGQKDWYRARFPIGDLIDLSTATHIQVALGCLDGCGMWYCFEECHGHAPMLDSVRLVRVDYAGPAWSIRDIDQFQDNFAHDGTNTGTVRADMANDVLASGDRNILPGDSSVVKVSDPSVGLALDAGNGRAAVYGYVAVWPRGQANKTGGALTQNPARWPVVGSWTDYTGVAWTCLQLDSSRVNGVAQPDFYCLDLNDNLFTPGDTVCFFYAAKNADGQETVAFGPSLQSSGADRNAAAAEPAEFTCLPAGGHNRGGDILYVDGMDGRGAQPYWDTAFRSLGLTDYVDRFDVRGPSSGVSNCLSSRVKNVFQLLANYRVILWDTGDLDIGLGDGSGTPVKTDDYQLLDDFLGGLIHPGGVYLSGDDVGQILAGYGGSGAVTFRTTYLTYNLVTWNARTTYGISPTGVPRAGGCYTDSFIIFGGCPLLNDFDVFGPTGTTTMEVGYGTPATTNGAVIANQAINGNGATVGAVMSGFSFIYIHDDDTDGISDRAKFLHDTLVWLADTTNQPTDAGPVFTNTLAQNYPNPFNPTTTITYSVRQRTHVRLLVYDVSGARVRVLADETVAAGTHVVKWNGRNDFGQPVASGVYFYQLISPVFSHTRKMVLLK